jgi:hypothetical protein
MNKIAKFDRDSLKMLRLEMQALLTKYGADMNIEFNIGNMKFSESEVEIKVSAKIAGAKTFTNVILESRVAALGLKMTNSLGDQLVDYNTKAYKMPYVYLNARDGKRYKCDERSVKIRFA